MDKMQEKSDVKLLNEAVQVWADSLAFTLSEAAPGMPKCTAEALKQLFDWPQVLHKSLAITILNEKLEERTSR